MRGSEREGGGDASPDIPISLAISDLVQVGKSSLRRCSSTRSVKKRMIAFVFGTSSREKNCRLARQRPGHASRVFTRRNLMATSADGSVRIWDPAAGTERLHFKAHSQGILKGIRALEFSPDGKRLVSCGIDQTVHEWDAATGKELEPMGGHQARLLAAAFSPDNRVLASASEDQTIRLWEVATGNELRRYDVDDLIGGSSLVGTQLRFSPDGHRLFANCSGSKIRSWDLSSGREVSLPAEQGRIPACLAISRNGRLLFASETPGSAPDPSARGAVSLWDTVTGRRVRRLEDVSRAVFQVGISSDGVFGIAS